MTTQSEQNGTPRKAAILGDPNVKPTVLPIIVENIPDELKTLRQWVVWRFMWRKKNKGQESFRLENGRSHR